MSKKTNQKKEYTVKNTLKVLGLIFGVFLYALYIVVTLWIAVWVIARGISLYQSWQEPDIARTTPVVQTTPTPIVTYNEARSEFMKHCDTGELLGQTAYCSCTFEAMIGKAGINGLVYDGLTLDDQQLLDKYGLDISYCASKTL